MYWPTAAARTLISPPPLAEEPIIKLRSSRKGNFFATLTRTGLGIWDVRPTVLQASVKRTEKSLERWGENIDIFWASDGRGLIILTASSHLIIYNLIPTSEAVYIFTPTPAFPQIAGPGEGETLYGWTLKPIGTAFIMGGCTSILPLPHSLMLIMRHPPSILTVPWPIPAQLVSPAGSHFPPLPLDGDGEGQVECDVWDMGLGGWIHGTPAPIGISMTRTPGLPTVYALSTDDGRAYAMYTAAQISHYEPTISRQSANSFSSQTPRFSLASTSKYIGQQLYPPPNASPSSEIVNGVEALGLVDNVEEMEIIDESEKAVEVAVNGKFGLVAVGTVGGTVHVIALPPYPQLPRQSHTFDLAHSANLRISPGSVTSLAWTSDGYTLAVGYTSGWAVWSMGGRLCGWGMNDPERDMDSGETVESFMKGVQDLFWAPGNLELFVLAKPGRRDGQIFSIPFAKSATTGQHSPDNTRYAFLQMDDRVLVYRGADQPDKSVINPESDVWQHIKIPDVYIATNWPIRYASISSDGKLIAVAGRRGLTHYSAASGRWKLFADEKQERNFVVRGGLLWFHHVLVAAIEVEKTYQLRLYSRDLDLEDASILHSQTLPSPITVMSLLDNSLLVYTADNNLYHFLILPTRDSIKLHLCGSISFQGILQVPSRVRGLSWLIPQAQKHLGDPADDLIVATIIFLVDGKLVLLRPRRAGTDEVRYDMQILADRIETYWTHLHGVGTLENSLWGYDGSRMRIWLDALTIEATKVDTGKDAYESVKESVELRLDFYPLSILMDKGIIIGVDYETSTRSLPFALFKIQTGTHLFLPPFLRYHLTKHNLSQALTFAANYQDLIYFAHSLEILLHSVLEDEVETGLEHLPTVIEFLDCFPESLDVVVGCARKTEVERWDMLFDVVGKPRELFERCLENSRLGGSGTGSGGGLRTAASYLLVLHNLEELDDAKDTIRLLRLAMAAKEYHLCKELLRFLHSIDESGTALRTAISEVELINPTTATQPASEIHVDTAGIPIIISAASSSSPTGPSVNSLTSVHRVSSPFQLSSTRLWNSPPSPRTVDQFEAPVDVPEGIR